MKLGKRRRRHSRYCFPLAAHIAVLPSVFPPRTLINEKFPAPIFLRRIDQSKKFTDPAARAHGAAVTSLRETRYRHEKITGEFFQGAPARNPYVRVPLARVRARAPARCCLPVNSYVHACVHAITWVCMHTRSRLNRRYESVRGGVV